jgi:hypothetical protein
MVAQRIQLIRAKGWRLPGGAISVARPSRWGNPYKVGSEGVSYAGPMYGRGAGFYDPNLILGCDQGCGTLSATQAVYLFRTDLEWALDNNGPEGDELRAALLKLRGHDLACWCPLNQPCHADVLIEFAAQDWPNA